MRKSGEFLNSGDARPLSELKNRPRTELFNGSRSRTLGPHPLFEDCWVYFMLTNGEHGLVKRDLAPRVTLRGS